MKYNINGLKMKLEQTNNNNTVYEQTMRKMIELISNLIEDQKNKDHLKRRLDSLIFNDNKLSNQNIYIPLETVNVSQFSLSISKKNVQNVISMTM